VSAQTQTLRQAHSSLFDKRAEKIPAIVPVIIHLPPQFRHYLSKISPHQSIPFIPVRQASELRFA
jgi:hypothetical protein